MIVWVLVFLCITILAAIAGTLSTVAWIAPAGGDRVVLRQLRAPLLPDDARAAFDPFVEQQVRQRMVSVYDRRERIESGVYAQEGYIGPAAILSAQGWAVLSIPQYARGSERNWDIVTPLGESYRVDKALPDAASTLVFIHINADGFRGDISFVDWEKTDITASSYFAFGKKGIQHALIESRPVDESGTHPLWRVAFPYHVVSDAPEGSLIFTDAGHMVGVIGPDHALIEGWLIAMQLRTLFDQQKLTYSAVPVSGRYVDTIAIDGSIRQQTGFYITQAQTRASTSTVARGDIITHINGEPITAATAARSLLFETGSIIFDILRAGQVAHVDVARSEVHP